MDRHTLRSRLVAGLGVASLATAPLMAATAPAGAAAPTPAPPPTPATPAPTPSPTGPVPAPAPTTTPAPPPAKAPITWRRCGSMQCGTLDVPLDHADPRKGTITVAISRRPADDQKRKLGVLFVNPGGPGGSSVTAVPMFAQILGRDVRARFDLVGVDPRGVGGSDLAICEGVKGETMPTTDVMFPWRAQQAPQFLAANEFLRHLCRTSKPRILPHMTTAEVARDMDLVRAALGQKKLNYYGVSYGSYLGATYANLYPRNVRTMVIDGVLDPVAWATGRGNEARSIPVTTRLRSDIGAQESLMSAIAECEAVGPTACREHDTIRDDWAAVSGRMRDKVVTVTPGDEGTELTYDLLIAMTLGSLYDPEAIPDLLALVHEFRVAADDPAAKKTKPAASLTRAYAKVVERDRRNRKERIGYDPPTPEPPEEEAPPTWSPMFEGVVCGETRNPTDPAAWIRAGAMADRRAPGFGPLWTWASSVCPGWPAKGARAYTGPFTARPAGGLMVMTTAHDPATPFSGARAMHAMSPGSRLVTVPGWGHATLDVSGCASKTRNDYLLSGRLPATDRICRPDHPLFTDLGR